MKMKNIVEVELRSDTMTKPTDEMREAMFTAVVGGELLLSFILSAYCMLTPLSDDGHGEDPTVKGELLCVEVNQIISFRP